MKSRLRMTPCSPWVNTTFLRRYKMYNVYIWQLQHNKPSSHKHNQFPVVYNYSSRTYSLYPALYLATIQSRLLPDYPNDPQSMRQLHFAYPMPGLSRTIRLLSEAGLLPDCSATIRSRASPGLSKWSPKPACSRTIWLLSEVGLSFTPETAQGLSTKAKTYLFNNYNTNIRKDKLSPHTHSWYQHIWHTVNTFNRWQHY